MSGLLEMGKECVWDWGTTGEEFCMWESYWKAPTKYDLIHIYSQQAIENRQNQY